MRRSREDGKEDLSSHPRGERRGCTHHVTECHETVSFSLSDGASGDRWNVHVGVPLMSLQLLSKISSLSGFLQSCKQWPTSKWDRQDTRWKKYQIIKRRKRFGALLTAKHDAVRKATCGCRMILSTDSSLEMQLFEESRVFFFGFCNLNLVGACLNME